MKRLYKFMRYRGGFFKEPTLRITQPCALNDPFECWAIPDTYSGIMYEGPSGPERMYGDNAIRALTEGGRSKPTAFGIVSMSQACDRVAMWSHYADEHRGLVLELDTEKIGLANRVVLSGAAAVGHPNDAKHLRESHPQAVFYSRKRSRRSFDMPSLADLQDAFLMKSDEWAYECESRIVACLADASRIEIPNVVLAKVWPLDESSAFARIDTDRGASILQTSTERVQKWWDERSHGEHVVPRDDGHRVWMARSAAMAVALQLSAIPEALFLYDLPRESVTAVVLGCEMPQEHRDEIMSDLLRGGYGAKLIQATVHPNRFELCFEGREC